MIETKVSQESRVKESLFYYFFQKGLPVWFTKRVSREIVQTFPGKKILLKLSDKIWVEIFPAKN